MENIIAKIPDLKTPTKIRVAMGAPLPTHADLLCTEKHKEHCGMLKPDVAGIIFNENQLTAELFINPNELPVAI